MTGWCVTCLSFDSQFWAMEKKNPPPPRRREEKSHNVSATNIEDRRDQRQGVNEGNQEITKNSLSNSSDNRFNKGPPPRRTEKSNNNNNNSSNNNNLNSEIPKRKLDDNNQNSQDNQDPQKRTKRDEDNSQLNSQIIYQYYPSSSDTDPIWDFKVETDIVSELKKEHPNTAFEYRRFEEVTRLRELYEKLCWNHVLRPPPGDSFNRWLFAQLTTPSSGKKDSLLSNPELAKDCRVLRFEIQRNLPASRYIRFGLRDSVSGLTDFIQNYYHLVSEWMSNLMADSSIVLPSDFSEVQLKVNSVLDKSNSWLSPMRSASDLYSHYNKLADEVFELLENTTIALTDPIMNTLVEETYNSLATLENMKLLATPIWEVKLDKNTESDIWNVTYGGDILKISKTHYTKLYSLYRIHNQEDIHCEKFLECLYVLLRRYYTFFGNLSGDSMHAAALPRVFQYLKSEFDVKQENFASPLNCYFKKFNSAFPDIDVFFGSLGSFFDFKPKTGSFETGPPYTEEVMYEMAIHVISLLDASSEPLSFTIFVPDWQNPPSPGLAVLEASNYLTKDFVISGKNHNYVIGSQHSEEVSKRYWTIPFNTHVYIMQNEAGNKKWFPSNRFIDGLKKKLSKD